MLIVVCGVSGCGKSSVASELAKQLKFEFADADDYHPEENKRLMRNGIPLNDQNRLPWLKTLRNLLLKWYSTHTNGVLACSALKQKYRHLLNCNLIYDDLAADGVSHDHEQSMLNLNILFVLLNCDKDMIEKRLVSRRDHDIIKDMSLINSQFRTLEMPLGDECLWSNDYYENDEHYHDTDNVDADEHDDDELCYLNLERSFNNSDCYYFIYVINCYAHKSVLEHVYKIMHFLPKFSNFIK